MAKAKQLPSGSWRVRVYVGRQDGKPVFRSFTGPNRKQVEAEAAAWAATAPEMVSREAMTLAQALNGYIEAKAKILSPTTVTAYKSIARTHLGGIKPLPLHKVTQSRVQAEINQLAAKASPKTVRNVTGLLTAALDMYAPEIRLHITLPQKEKTPLRIPSRDEVETLCDAVRGTPLEIPILLAAGCGLRRSEICGLRLADVGKDYIRITRALVENSEHELVEKAPKTFAGTRTVDCDEGLADLIRSKGHDPVCELTPDQISDRFRHLIKKLGVGPFRFHDLRHYYASEGLRLGVPSRYVADMMGHSSAQTTERIYQHVFADSRREMGQALAERAGALLGGKH